MTASDKIPVWDWPVRVGHWLLAGAFLIAWLSGDSEEWRLVHAYAGGAMVGVVLFRLLWGIIGTRYARFSEFVRGIGAAKEYALGLLRGSAPHTTGHNPAGAWAILALLALILLTGASGWLVYQEIGGDRLEELHEVLASTLLGVVFLHLAGVIAGSLVHRENLVRAMLNGRKSGAREDGIPRGYPTVALALLIWVGLCAYWLAR